MSKEQLVIDELIRLTSCRYGYPHEINPAIKRELAKLDGSAKTVTFFESKKPLFEDHSCSLNDILHEVIEAKGSISTVSLLMALGGSLNLNDTLTHAIYYDNLEVVKFLLNSHPELLNKHDTCGSTPLSVAIKHQKIFEFLLEQKGDLNLCVNYGDKNSVLKIAQKSGVSEIVALIEAQLHPASAAGIAAAAAAPLLADDLPLLGKVGAFEGSLIDDTDL